MQHPAPSIRLLLSTLFLVLLTATAQAAGIRLEDFAYPFPVQTFVVEGQRQTLEMAYMDRKAEGEEHGVVLLLHGKNFSGAYWEKTARALSAEGYRVVMPDQIGFGKSSKPHHYQFSFHQLATNTRDLLDHLQVEEVFVLGHSMGGMLATRFALLYPERTRALVLENPIGLEDWLAEGVSYPNIEQTYRAELRKTEESIRAYQLSSYYDGQWKAAYDPWVRLLASFCESPEYAFMAWNQALTTDMVLTQPVCHEFGDIAAPTLLIIGQRDRTAIGRATAPPELKARLGNYPELGRAALAAIPDAELVELEGIGHLPHIEAFPLFREALLEFLEKQ